MPFQIPHRLHPSRSIHSLHLFTLSFPQISSYTYIGTMPTSVLIQFMAHALWWISGLLRGMLTNCPLLPSLVPFDEIGRAVLMASPLWPGNQVNMGSDLSEVLAALLFLFTELLSRGSNTY